MNTMHRICDFADVTTPTVPVDFPESDWKMLLTEPNREMTTQANLVIRHVPFYLPTMLSVGRIAARARNPSIDATVVRPLFPGVIFIATAVAEAYDDLIRRTPGVLSPAKPYIRFGEHAAILSPQGMQAIRYIEAGEREMYCRARARPTPGYVPKVGDSVRVLVNQVLGGYGGTVAEVDDAGRITVLMDIMKRTVRVKMTRDQVDAV